MCGIAGLVYRDRSREIEPSVLDVMTDVMVHRGPDDRGTIIWGNVGFGHRRLAIIDLEGGHQPMSNADGTIWVTYNGELYNYIELRSVVLQQGYRLRTYSDTEVLIHLYAIYGTDMFRHMNGMFAFAIFDRRQGQILIGRDRFGEKPVYYYTDGEKLIFASEIKALLTVPGVRAEVDYAAINEYLTFQYCLGERTLFRNVRKVDPASYLLLDLEGDIIESKEYWAIDFEEDHSRSEEYYINELRFLLEDAVKVRLRSDVPVGTYLSGGIDSSVVASMASKLMGHGLQAFTGAFSEDERFSEVRYARAVADQNCSELEVVYPTSADFAANIRKLIYHMDEPAAGPGLFPQYMVSKQAAQRLKVVLGGQGGDEVFGGYARYLILYLEESIKGSIFQSQDPGRHIVTLSNVLPNLASLQQYVPMLKQFWSRGVFDPIERRYFQLVARIPRLDQYFTPDFLSGRDEDAIFAAFERHFNDILQRVSVGGSALFNRMSSYDLRTMLQSLLQVEDRMSMAVSLESRMPLLDHRIVELMFKCPPLFKYRDGKAKALLLAAANTLLPPLVLNRRDKMGFPVPFAEWARGDLNLFLKEVLLGKAAEQRGIYRLDNIAHLIDREQSFGRELWGILSLELWFQTFIDTNAQASLHP